MLTSVFCPLPVNEAGAEPLGHTEASVPLEVPANGDPVLVQATGPQGLTGD